jgi:hypothetical protein
VVNFQDSNIINNWENNSADALQPFFGPLVPSKIAKNHHYFGISRESHLLLNQ